MSTLKPNKLEQLQKQLEKIPNSQFPQEINATERHLFHVIIVKKNVDLKDDKITYKLQHKKFNQKSFEVNKVQFAKLGYTDVHILHDPTGESLEEIIKPIDSNNDEFEKLQKELEEAKNKIDELTAIDDDNPFDVETAKANQLRSFAKTNEIDIKGLKKGDEIREVVKNWIDENPSDEEE